MLSMGPFGYPLDYLILWALYVSLVVHTVCFFRSRHFKKRTRLGLLTGNLLVFSCLGGLAALAVESCLRFVSTTLDPFGMSIPSRRWFALHAKLNSLGCRDREWTVEKPPSVRRIAFVGDSFTYGWGIERVDDRFSERIAEQFERIRPGQVEIMNVAKPGWGTSDQIQPIRDMIHYYGADEIVLCYVFNDIEKAIPQVEGFDPTRPPEPRFFNPDGSCLIDYLYRRLVVPRRATVRGHHDWLAGGYYDVNSLRVHQEQLGAILQSCREAKVPLRVVLLPFLHVGGARFDRGLIHSIIRGFLEVNGVTVVDLLAAIENRDVRSLVVNRLDSHPNEAAHALFAEWIWNAWFANAPN